MSDPHGPPAGPPPRGSPPPQWGRYSSPPDAAPYAWPGAPPWTQPQPPYGESPAARGHPVLPHSALPGQPEHAGCGPRPPGSAETPQGFPDPAREGGRTRRGPWLFGGIGVAVAAVVAFLGFVTPGWFHRSVFDAAAVQKGVQRILEDAYGVRGIESVGCPSGQPVKIAHTFACRVTVGGRDETVTITVLDAEGTYEVGHLR
ncbi:uncharacterized protein DUF4333 [Halopolyspora algeriensis]|uniref:Uncharacterized protein DUF4333 n=1 Tax=Halopolyspora algeriensis TaxID=1500506 RepID=A0A368VJ93_9ACTN|nr:DUF4333 domain-containing protein [Halopolyspora algeriensis]RCW40481.1 uncharacterized protein DUF4333 [Halopolyspora algeriensis]TQM53764.1 uncharacterized protein DUF4333 [Halopolyspora algeriensis]